MSEFLDGLSMDIEHTECEKLKTLFPQCFVEDKLDIDKLLNLYRCLAEHITTEDAETMAEYAPGRIIFSEQCFEDTTDKSNVKLTLRDRGINIKML